MNFKKLNYLLFELKAEKLKVEVKMFEASFLGKKYNNLSEDYQSLENEINLSKDYQSLENEINALETVVGKLRYLMNSKRIYSPEYWEFLKEDLSPPRLE